MKLIRFDQPCETTQSLWLSEAGEYRVELAAEGLEIDIRGAFRTRQQDQLQVTLEIVHLAPHTTSATLLRGVAEDQSELILSGTIIVTPEARHTNAFLTENVLLLHPGARAEALPNLEIATDEVKCSHAATVSSLSPEQLFYLQSRGLSLATAQDMIVAGFLAQAQPPEKTA